jgi:PAS domain S-box-containing protein
METLRILVVDDHQNVRQGVRALLSSHAGWLICGEAEDGIDALEKARELLPDIILMDVTMPRMNGIEATRILSRELPQSKVVIVSQNDRAIVSRQAKDAGAEAFVAKSDIVRGLLSTIEGICAGRRLETNTHFTNTVKEDATSGSPRIENPSTNGSVPLESILCTEELKRRIPRPSDYKKENIALVELAEALADSPQTVLQVLSDNLLSLCNAGSVGVSLLSSDDGGKRFYWPAIAGSWKAYIGGGTPRDFGPCGDVLDRNSTLLMTHVERRYTYFQPVQPSVEEAILVPFYVEGKAVGTIWAVAHETSRKFDAEDERLMKSLGKFASSAYQLLASIGALKATSDDRKQNERASNLLAAVVDSSDDAIITKSLDGVITSWNKSAERLFGHTSEEAIGKHIFLIIPENRRNEETRIVQQLKQGQRVDHFETQRRRKDGTLVDLSLTISPVKDESGRIAGASKIARDITQSKQIERALRLSEEKLLALTESLEAQVQARTIELEQRNSDIQDQAEQLRELSNRLLKTQDDERRHIARELHDSAGQIIAALGMNLASLSQRASNNPALAKALEDTQNLVQQLNREIRTTSYLLHPPLLDENGLAQAIEWYMQGLKERSGLDVDLIVSDDFGRLPPDLELSIFRIVQESLTNIHRHSGSKAGTIRLSRGLDSVSLQIQDQGKGLSAKKLAEIKAYRSGIGLTGMRERVRHFNGQMDIQSNGSGTTISVDLPVVVLQSNPS